MFKSIFALVIIGSLTAVSSVAQQPVPVTSTVTVPKGTYLRFATVKALDPAQQMLATMCPCAFCGR